MKCTDSCRFGISAVFTVFGLLLAGAYYSTFTWLVTMDWVREDYKNLSSFYKNSLWNFTTSVLSFAVAYNSSGSLLTSKNRMPQLTQPRICAARSCSPRI